MIIWCEQTICFLDGSKWSASIQAVALVHGGAANVLKSMTYPHYHFPLLFCHH